LRFGLARQASGARRSISRRRGSIHGTVESQSTIVVTQSPSGHSRTRDSPSRSHMRRSGPQGVPGAQLSGFRSTRKTRSIRLSRWTRPATQSLSGPGASPARNTSRRPAGPSRLESGTTRRTSPPWRGRSVGKTSRWTTPATPSHSGGTTRNTTARHTSRPPSARPADGGFSPKTCRYRTLRAGLRLTWR
jgi:hypothetical protein